MKEERTVNELPDWMCSFYRITQLYHSLSNRVNLFSQNEVFDKLYRSFDPNGISGLGEFEIPAKPY